MLLYNLLHPKASAATRSLSFIKEEGIWYADLPEFLELGLGTKANLMMVDGADTFLDLLSNHQAHITLHLSRTPFPGQHGAIRKTRKGMNPELLQLIGHAPVDYGAYYEAFELHGQSISHQLWLCPVTEYVFGEYPDQLFFSITKK